MISSLFKVERNERIINSVMPKVSEYMARAEQLQKYLDANADVMKTNNVALKQSYKLASQLIIHCI
jgi:hypothetical protein